jgi:hypothetical protein
MAFGDAELLASIWNRPPREGQRVSITSGIQSEISNPTRLVTGARNRAS